MVRIDGTNYSPFFNFMGKGTGYCVYTYDATGYEEFWAFTEYNVNSELFWGIL